MGIPVKLQVFEGPLDLLLHLIDINKVNIYDIPIVEITEQYMEYIREMQRQDLDIVSEFLVMAATLLNIKSRMLLPREIDEDGEEIDPRQELVEKLLEYKMYKYMSYELKDRQIDAAQFFYKQPTIPKEVLNYTEPVDLEELLSGISLLELNAIFRNVMKRQNDRIDPIRSKYGNIEKEEFSLDTQICYVNEYIKLHDNFLFSELVHKSAGKMEIVVTFLVVLEFMKNDILQVEQEHLFDDIRIKVINREGVERANEDMQI